MQVNITPCLQNKRLTSLPFHVMYGFQTAIDIKRKRGRLDFDLMKVDEGAIEWNSLNELRKLNECMVPTQHLQHIQTIEWIKVLQIHFVLILVMSLENLWIKFFFSKISSATGYADIIFQKNNFVRIAASVIYLHVAWGGKYTPIFDEGETQFYQFDG